MKDNHKLKNTCILIIMKKKKWIQNYTVLKWWKSIFYYNIKNYLFWTLWLCSCTYYGLFFMYYTSTACINEWNTSCTIQSSASIIPIRIFWYFSLWQITRAQKVKIIRLNHTEPSERPLTDVFIPPYINHIILRQYWNSIDSDKT